MFDKWIRKGQQLAGDYLREQQNKPSNNNRSGGGYQNQSNGYGFQSESSGYGFQNQPFGSGYQNQPQAPAPAPNAHYGQQASAEDRAAIEKYRYMLRTAPPQDMERAHAEAFARLTPQQRGMLYTELSGELPAYERPASDKPEDLARAATRAEVSKPGFMEKILGGGSGRGRMAGGVAAGAAGAAGGLGLGLMAGVAAGFVGSAIAGPLLEGFSGLGEQVAGAAEGFADQGGGLFGDVFGSADEGFGGFDF
ncbi:hypothetical protein [Glutamicibacter sp.]|uniref:hypothetical protein n=1 Tax=Glutamicibacter sp. TaxID=1931995 RepID=UPI0028BD3908|nr:hypothetical protein [Glutamicibacter sp.]